MSLPVSKEYFTSLLVKGFPSLHFTPRRSVTTYVVPCQRPFVASHGMYRSFNGSYRNIVS